MRRGGNSVGWWPVWVLRKWSRAAGREKDFQGFIWLHLRVQLFLPSWVWMKGRLLWNAKAWKGN
nr:MAG TPA: hypothetical protein [Caudoviricetes sp.]